MTQLKLVIGNKNYSSWSLRPWFFLTKHGVAFVEERVTLDTPNFKSQVAKYNSGEKVPVLVDAGFSVWDSLAIMEYVSENYTHNKGWPQERRARARARSVSAEMHSSFAAMRDEMPMNCRKVFQNYAISSAAQLNIERITDIWKACRRDFGAQGAWLFGDFSIADAMFAPVALRFSTYQITLTGSAGAYLDTLLNDEAIQQWVGAAERETEIVEQDER